jgi:glycosyltransferase involved in cell wall biosynthesis
MKIALVHDYLIRFGGAERVLLNLWKIFPQAEIFTLLYNEEKMGKYFPDTKIHTSFLQNFPFSRKHHRILAPLMPAAVESLDLRDFDLVISSSSAFAKGLVLRPKAIHICYCHSPTRFLWDYTHQYQSRLSFFKKLLFHYLRMWDRAAANRVDYFIANSKTTAQRIRKYYDQEAKVIYPPVNIKAADSSFASRSPFWTNNTRSAGGDPPIGLTRSPKATSLASIGPPSRSARLFTSKTPYASQKDKSAALMNGEYFLIVSQLSPYKRIDLAIDAFNKLELPLVIIGQGRDRKRLQKMARSNIKFLGWQSDETVRQYLQNCTAFIFPGEDDFGIAPVEAMSFGKPVLAYRQGGATETILEGITGEFFDDPASEALADGLRRLRMNLNNYSPLVIKKRAEKFSPERFETTIKEFVIEAIEQSKKEF